MNENGKEKPVAGISNQECFEALAALREFNQYEIETKDAIHLRKLYKELESHVEIVRELLQETVKKHAVLDEAGELTFDARGEPVIQSGKQATYQKAYSNIMSSEWPDAPKIEMRIVLQVPKVKTAILVGLDKFLEQADDSTP